MLLREMEKLFKFVDAYQEFVYGRLLHRKDHLIYDVITQDLLAALRYASKKCMMSNQNILKSGLSPS